MQYNTLQDLLSGSRSSRDYFLTLPVSMQMALHRYNDEIHTAADLHCLTDLLEKYQHAVDISHFG